MSRVFPALVFSDILLLCAAAALGFLVDGDKLYPQHFGLAIFTIVLTILIHVVVFTYFSVTGRMMSQAVFIGKLDRTPLDRIKLHKWQAGRRVGMAVLSIVVVSAFGALSAREGSGHNWHLVAAFLVVAVNTWAFYGEYDLVVRQSELMTQVLSDYDAAKGQRPAVRPTT